MYLFPRCFTYAEAARSRRGLSSFLKLGVLATRNALFAAVESPAYSYQRDVWSIWLPRLVSHAVYYELIPVGLCFANLDIPGFIGYVIIADSLSNCNVLGRIARTR